MGWPIPLNTCHEFASMGQMRPVSFFFFFFLHLHLEGQRLVGLEKLTSNHIRGGSGKEDGSQRRKSRSSSKTGSDEEGGCPIPPIPFVKYIHNRPYIYNHIISDSIPDQACPNRTKPEDVG